MLRVGGGGGGGGGGGEEGAVSAGHLPAAKSPLPVTVSAVAVRAAVPVEQRTAKR